MRSLLFLGGGILIGAGLVHAEARVYAEKQAAEKLKEEIASHKRVLEMAAENFLADRISEAPAKTEGELDPTFVKLKDMAINRADVADDSDDAIKVGGEMVQETSLSSVTPSSEYLQTAQDYSEISVNDPIVPVQYISSDDYDEEDGRAKEQILIHMGEDQPLFICEGIVVENWQSLISPNILVDMYSMCPPGTEKILYVRNHLTDTDYEVIQEIP